LRPDSGPSALAALEARPGYRVQRVLADRVNFVVEEDGRASVYGKVYEKPTLRARLCQRAGRDPGLREAVLLESLGRSGVPVPAVVAGGRLADGRSFVATRAVEGALPLDDALRRGAIRAGADRRAALVRLARAVRRLHDAGFVHRDLYLCHVLLSAGGRLVVIDWGRALKRRRLRWRVKDLAALHASAPPGIVTARDSLRFLREYLGKRVSLRPWARRVARKAARYRSHVPRRRGAAPRAAAGVP